MRDMTPTVRRTTEDLTDERDRLLAACETKLRAVRFGEHVTITEELALAADDLARAAYLSGILEERGS